MCFFFFFFFETFKTTYLKFNVSKINFETKNENNRMKEIENAEEKLRVLIRERFDFC